VEDVSEHRPHLSIGEVLALLQPEFPDVTISKIRFLESQGLLDPERTPSGYRKFYEDDLARLRYILTLQRDQFLPLKVIKERLVAPSGTASDNGSASETPVVDAGNERPPAAVAMPSSLTPAPPAPTAGDRAALADALARRAAQRAGEAARPPRHAAAGGGHGFDLGVSDTSLTTAELAAAAGIAERDVDRLASFGLIEGRTIGREMVFEGDALVVARLASAFLEHGLEPRHLRMFKVAADRETGVYEQLVQSLTRQRDNESRLQAEHRLVELAELGNQLRTALLRRAIHDLLKS
jgi:DNA-binding transcriptional MerR regulator